MKVQYALAACLAIGLTAGYSIAPRETVIQMPAGPLYTTLLVDRDCGIYLGRGVTGVTVSGGIISGHEMGVCIDGDGSVRNISWLPEAPSK